jgi:two-component system, NtrC family, nitrogen regulation sensor histidine kinase NtrY
VQTINPDPMSDATPQTNAATVEPRHRSRLFQLGRIGVVLALLSAVTTLAVFADYTPITPTNQVVLTLFAINGLFILLLVGLLLAEVSRLIAARRAQAAGSRLHVRIVSLFSIIAAVPAILLAVVGWITLERTLNPAFLQDVRGFIGNTGEAGRHFNESQCRALLREAKLTATDLDRVNILYTTNRALYREFFMSRANFLNFSSAAIIDSKGKVIERGTGTQSRVVTPEAADFEEARKDNLTCLVLDNGQTFVALRALTSIPDGFIYAERPVDPFAVEFPRQAQALMALYNAYDAHRRNIQIAFATMFVMIALIMLLSATWMGLSFANSLALPIRRLIAATDQVSSGNLYVQVPTMRGSGDLQRLGDTFNNMTSELRLQQNRLLAASRLNDERRLFIEAVLSGVPAGVIGTDEQGRITIMNAYAQALIAEASSVDPAQINGSVVKSVLPELADLLQAAQDSNLRIYQGQITLTRRGRERIFNVRTTREQASPAAANDASFVVTLDDITDLVTAQRTSAWADVARRIAHEIKNPLTPIQLSAERIKRKYGRLITQDKEIFDQCTDTIIRHVDDIKRMVDEFSSFARMPKPKLEVDDLAETVRQSVFLMRVGNPDISIEAAVPDEPLKTHFDRRLLSQALTNIIKNATEAIKGAEPAIENPRIDVTLSVHDGQTIAIDIIDNGKGFPGEGRQRLLEPYMTTRAEGTGLGLAIVAKILEDHGGGIELLDSPHGAGAWVRLHFPYNAPPDAAADPNPANEPRRAGRATAN